MSPQVSFLESQVAEAREMVKTKLFENSEAIVYYELTGPVKSRWMADCKVKIVDNQWFLAYGDEKWTETTELALKSMELYPSKARNQFEYVLQWLNNWACVREKGLGTKLPWDDNWVIESLSDSTIYMAFYTVAHHLKDLDEDKLTDTFVRSHIWQWKHERSLRGAGNSTGRYP